MYVTDVAVAGIPVRIESNVESVTRAVRARHSGPVHVDAPGAMQTAPCSMRVTVTDADAAFADGEPTWRFPTPDEVTVRGGGIVATLDVAAGTGDVLVSRTLVQDAARFHRMVVEGMPLVLINRRDRHPVHAAALRRGDTALLLHGPSGVGKSTLAYVAHRAGIDVLSDDSARIQLAPELRVWGDGSPARVHLLGEARRDFPELQRYEPVWMAGTGITKLSIDTMPAQQPFTPFATRVGVCLLTRDGGAISRRAASTEEIRAAVLQSPEAPLDLSPMTRERVAAALAARNGWHLNLGRDPRDALPQLLAMFDESALMPVAR